MLVKEAARLATVSLTLKVPIASITPTVPH